MQWIYKEHVIIYNMYIQHIIHYVTYNIDIQIHKYHILVWFWQMTIVTDVVGTARGLEASNSLEAVRQAAVRKPPAFCHASSWPGLQSHSRCLGPQKTDLEHTCFLCFLAFSVIWDLIFNDRFCDSKPKVCRFGRIEKARLWRVMREAAAAEVGLVRGVQFRFERNWGEDRSRDVANELAI